MAERINAASRLHKILTVAARKAETEKTVDVWASVFEISEADPAEKALKVAEGLLLLDEELRTLAVQMRQTALTKHYWFDW